MESKKWRGTCCVAWNCSNRQGKRSTVDSSSRDVDITFHRFPSNFELRGEWMTAIRRQNFKPASNSRICSEHFKKTDFTASKNRRRLRENAIPSIFNFPPHLQPKTKMPRRKLKRHVSQKRRPLCDKSVTDRICHDHLYFCTPKTQVRLTCSRPTRLKSKMVYLDYNATTPLAPEVITAIQHSLSEAWGNPSSTHEAGVKAKAVISTARKHVAAMIGAKPTDIIFTSGGTEGNNWILRMAIDHFNKTFFLDLNGFEKSSVKNAASKPHFITSNIEHDSVKIVLEQFQKEDLADVTFVPVQQSSGSVSVEDIISAVRPTTIMVTIMLANNETGVLQPVSNICSAIRSLKRGPGETPRILLHTDAAQALGKTPVNIEDLGVDYLTIVGHKFYAPRIGAIFALDPNQNVPVYPLVYGGGQERNFRPGTENTPMIAGLGKAAELVCENLERYQAHMKEVRDYLETKLLEVFESSVTFNGKSNQSERLPNTCNVSFVGEELKGHEILARTPSVQASVGAACHSQDRPSHILLALGVKPEAAWKALRISVGRETTKDDIDSAIKELQAAFLD